MIIPVKLTSCFNNMVQRLFVPLSVHPHEVSIVLEFSSWPRAKIQLRKREKKKLVRTVRRGKDFPSRLSYWWASEWSMLAHAEDSDALSIYLPRSVSILLPSLPLYVICPWQFYLYVVHQCPLPGLMHSSFLQEGCRCRLCRNQNDVCSFISPRRRETLQMGRRKNIKFWTENVPTSCSKGLF